jgi:hypothetical protein
MQRRKSAKKIPMGIETERQQSQRHIAGLVDCDIDFDDVKPPPGDGDVLSEQIRMLAQ